jgi:signal peptidase
MSFSRLARSLLTVTAVTLLTAAAGWSYLRLHGEYLLSVQSASMAPLFRPGDALLVKAATFNDLKAGEVISYQSPSDSRLIISHRLLKIDRHNGLLTMAGDALGSPDPPFDRRLLMGKATAILPGFGSLLNALRHPVGLILAVYIPVLVILVGEVNRLRRLFNRVVYRLIA